MFMHYLTALQKPNLVLLMNCCNSLHYGNVQRKWKWLDKITVIKLLYRFTGTAKIVLRLGRLVNMFTVLCFKLASTLIYKLILSEISL